MFTIQRNGDSLIIEQNGILYDSENVKYINTDVVQLDEEFIERIFEAGIRNTLRRSNGTTEEEDINWADGILFDRRLADLHQCRQTAAPGTFNPLNYTIVNAAIEVLLGEE